MVSISVNNLAKTYTVSKRDAGLGAAIKSLVHRKTRDVKAVDGISFNDKRDEIVGFLGILVLAVALTRRGVSVGLEETVAFALVLICGGSIIYSFWLMLATLSFWFIRIENILVIFQTMYEAGRWPIGIYPYWLKFILTFIVPIAFAITVPAQALTGRLTNEELTLDVGLAVVMLIVSRLFWRIGLRNYSGASA
ncbi:MAG: ABC-2 family transporter protein [Candidatus Latescibacterota bacterium]|nr:ABC-2 family transporter protein [Candidatus Latescibacterota bacterium]